MSISAFGLVVFFACVLAVYIIIDKAILGHFRKKEIAAIPEGQFGSQKWLIMWTVIVTLAVAWNPVGLKVGSWLSIQFGILYRDVEAVINAPAAVAAVPVGPPTALPTVGATTPASTALAPVAVINKSMWTVGTDGLITFNPPPSGWKWMVRANSSTPPFEPPPGFGLLGASNAEVYLQSVADPTKVTTALWLK